MKRHAEARSHNAPVSRAGDDSDPSVVRAGHLTLSLPVPSFARTRANFRVEVGMRPETRMRSLEAYTTVRQVLDLSDPTRAAEWPSALNLPEGTRAKSVAVASTTVIR